MIGLAYLLFFGEYLLLSLGLTIGVMVWARKRDKRVWLWGLGVLLIMYHLVFWDWLPSIVQHEYYCRNHAGFWVYKSMDQWKQENPGVFETLVQYAYRDKNTDQTIYEEEGWTSHSYLNDRFEFVSQFRHEDVFGLDFGLRVNQRAMVDYKKGEVLAKYVGFAVSSGEDGVRFWKSRTCRNNEQNQHKFWAFVTSLEGKKP